MSVKYLRRLLAVLRWMYPRRFVVNVCAGVASQVVGLVMVMFIVGSIGTSAVVMASNQTAYAGAPATVVTMWTIGVPSLIGVAIVLHVLPRRS